MAGNAFVIRKILSIICGFCFFGATLYSVLHTVSLGTVLSFISGTSFLIGTVMDHHDIFRYVEAAKEPRDRGTD